MPQAPAPCPTPAPAPPPPPADDTTPTPTPAPTPAPAPCPPPAPAPCPPPAPAPAPPPAYNDTGTGQYNGDPHFTGFGGEKYDVQGKSGNTYNILSTKNLQYNAEFDKPNGGIGQINGTDVTTITKTGITSGKDKLEYDLGSTPTLNGKALDTGKTYNLDDGGTATWDGSKLNFKNDTYTINLSKDPNDASAILSDVKINDGANPLTNGTPTGLLGQTADGVAGAHVGKNNTNDQEQGGNVIDGTVDQYETSGLFDTSFKKFNSFNG